MRSTVIVAMVVDDDRGAVVADQAAAERLGQQRRDEYVVRGAVCQHAACHQQDPVGAASFGEVMGREYDEATVGGVLLDHLEDAKLARADRAR